MVIISSMWRIKGDEDLIGCGIDSEHIVRFTKWGTDRKEASPFVFSEKELDYFFTLDDPAIGLCTSFCSKEALFKALEQPFDYTSCELFWHPSLKEHKLILDDKLRNRHCISKVKTELKITTGGECIIVVYLIGKKKVS
jgi:phosphopantetheinyl transferase (holo-ACP synthase)